MKRVALALAVLAACKRPSPAAVETVDAGAAPLATTATPTIRDASVDDRVRDIVEKWNAAHASRDANALRKLYAAKLSHYGKELTREQGVKEKERAFAATPDFTQSIGKITVREWNGAAGTGRKATFTKTVHANGKTNDYPAVLVVMNDEIIEEDDDTGWCIDHKEHFPSDEVVPPFTMSATEAWRLTNQSKFMRAKQKKHPDAQATEKGFGCARACGGSSRECGFHIVVHDLASTAPSTWVDDVYVDPYSRKLYYRDWNAMGDGGKEVWLYEQLPPPGDH